jgi:hypothetical protein
LSLFGVLITALVNPALGAEQFMPLIEFSIKPRLCVLTAQEEICQDQLEVKWSSPEMRSLCLYQKDKAEPLRCWEDATHGEYAFELSASSTTGFQLRDTATQEALSKQEFRVVYEDKKYRTPRRNPWSFHDAATQ